MKLRVTAILLMFLLLAGCTTLIQKSGELLEGKAFAEKTVNLYRSVNKPAAETREILLRNGEKEIVISSPAYPGLKLRGRRIINGTGSLIFTQAEFISTHVHGWNEFTLELEGTFSFMENNINMLLKIQDPPEGILISTGRICYKDTRITGETALTNLRNRRERILAIIEWMNQNNPPEFSSQKDFEQYWKRLLFPELAGKNQQPPEYSSQNVLWVKGNGVSWNQQYTQSIFPEELWELRNSGALLRDWEESLSWIYLEYSWNSIAEFFNGMEFKK